MILTTHGNNNNGYINKLQRATQTYVGKINTDYRAEKGG